MLIYLLPLLIIVFAVTGASYSILSIFRLQPSNPTERLVINLGGGMIFLSFTTYLLGYLGMLKPDLLLFYFILIFLFGTPHAGDLVNDISEVFKRSRLDIYTFIQKNSRKTVFNLLLLSGFLLIIFNTVILFLASFTPPTGWDALNYHLSVPKIYLLNEQIISLPTLFHSHFPLPIQFQNLFLMAVGNDIVAQGLQFVYFIGVLFIVYHLVCRYLSSGILLLANIILFSIPVFLFSVPEAHVDMAAAFYAMLTVLCILSFRENNDSRYMFLAFLFSGFLATTKYTNLPFIALTPGVFLIMSRFDNIRIDPMNILAGFIISTGIAVSFYLKTWIYTGNPFWPYFYKLFPTHYPPNVMFDSGQVPLVSSLVEEQNPIWQKIRQMVVKIFTKPWRMTFFPEQFGGDSPKVGPVMLQFFPAVLAIFASRKRNYEYYNMIYIFIITAGFFILWLVFFHNSRYLVPIFPLVAILIAKGIYKLFFDHEKLYIIVLVILIGALGLSTLTTVKLHLNKLPAAITFLSRDDYYRTLPHPLGDSVRIPEYAASVYANQNLDYSKDKVLILQGLFGYFLDVPYDRGRPDAQSQYDYSKITSAEELNRLLKDNNVSHILTVFPPSAISEYKTFSAEDLLDIGARSERGFEIMEHEFITDDNYVNLMFNENEIYLYEVQYE